MKLKEFLNIYNFRNYRADLETESKKYDTNIIRIYLDDNISNDDYIEFGVYDYSECEYKEHLYKQFIKEEILNRKIYSMCFDYELNTFCVYLESQV